MIKSIKTLKENIPYKIKKENTCNIHSINVRLIGEPIVTTGATWVTYSYRISTDDISCLNFTVDLTND